VAPDRQGNGIGALLMRHGLAEAERMGHAAVLLVGDAPYYGRFGFTRALTQRLVLPGPVEPERFLGLELVPGALDGACGDVSANVAGEGSSFASLTELLPIQTYAPPAGAGS
jgi:predicted N-acetyltransferase YhbS